MYREVQMGPLEFGSKQVKIFQDAGNTLYIEEWPRSMYHISMQVDHERVEIPEQAFKRYLHRMGEVESKFSGSGVFHNNKITLNYVEKVRDKKTDIFTVHSSGIAYLYKVRQ